MGSRARRAAAAAVAAVTIAAVSVPGAQAEEPEFIPGNANASTQVARVRLFYAGFTFEMSAGTTIASYRNQTARASSGALNVASVLGLAGQSSEPPTTASSTDGDQHVEAALTDPPLLGRTSASATRQPASSAAAELAAVAIPGVLEIEGGSTSAHSELVPGSHRIATATTEVAAISLAGGLVELRGLRWTATHRSGADPSTEARFDLTSLAIAGLPVPVSALPLSGVLALVNDALAPVGLVLQAPEVLHLPDGSIDVTGLQIGIANSPLGGQVIAPLISAVRPLLLPLLGSATDVNEQLGLLGLFLDLGLGVVDGSGGVILSIGGANAGTDDQTYADLLGAVPEPRPLSPVAVPKPSPRPVAPVTTAPVVAAPATPRVAEPNAVEITSVGPLECVLAASPNRQGSCRSHDVGAAVGVVAVTLAGLALLEARARRRAVPARSEGATP